LRYINPVVLSLSSSTGEDSAARRNNSLLFTYFALRREGSTAKNFIIRSDDVGVNASFEYTRNYDS